MSDLGVDVPPPREPPRAMARIASAIWLAVAAPFLYLGSLYWNWPASIFSDWRGWVFAAAGLVCLAMAIVVPARYRTAIVGTKLR